MTTPTTDSTGYVIHLSETTMQAMCATITSVTDRICTCTETVAKLESKTRLQLQQGEASALQAAIDDLSHRLGYVEGRAPEEDPLASTDEVH